MLWCKECKSIKECKRKCSTLHMGQKKSYIWDVLDCLWCFVSTKLIGDS
jgi:hypothetical protein